MSRTLHGTRSCRSRCSPRSVRRASHATPAPARATGLAERGVMRRHLLANLRAPLVTLFALALPGTVAGSVFVETIFGWPGMGRLMVTAIVARDYPVVLGCAAAYAAVVIVANLAAELLLAWADPRVST